MGFNDDDSTVLRQIQYPVISREECISRYAKLGFMRKRLEEAIDQRIVCADSSNDIGVCFGDSGGPLMLPIYQDGIFQFYQIGIVSGSEYCGKRYVPDFYTSVQYYIGWIEEKLKLKY